MDYLQGTDEECLEGSEVRGIPGIPVIFCLLIQVMLHTSVHLVKTQQDVHYFMCTLWHITL